MSARIGERGSLELFLTAVRFALPIWATTHAVEYVRLGVNLLSMMRCASPALLALYKGEIFTRMSATGQSLPADLIMEKSVGHLRKKVGKVEHPGMDQKIEIAINEIPNQPPQDLEMDTLRMGSYEARQCRSVGVDTLKEKSPLIKGFELIHSGMEFWHHSKQPIIDRDSKNNPIWAEPNSYKLPKGETLNPQVLDSFAIGSSCVKMSVQKNDIDDPYKVECSEKDVSLTKILATSLDRKNELKRMIDRAISLDKTDLDKAMNKDESWEELLEVIDLLNSDVCPLSEKYISQPSKSKMNKVERINKLIELRKLLFEGDSDVKAKKES